MVKGFWEDIKIGDLIRTQGRTVTETDVVTFCYLSGHWLDVHSDRHYAATTAWGERLAPGLLLTLMIPGMTHFPPKCVLAAYGVDRIRWIHPVKIGDTIHVESELVKKEDRDERGGIASLDCRIYNQDNVQVEDAVFKLYVAKRSYMESRGIQID